MKILPVGAELFHVDRRMDGQTEKTDRHNEANSCFQQFQMQLKKRMTACI